jgi:hypothetical protein
MPDEPVSSQAIIAAVNSAHSGHRGEHGKAQGEASTITFTTPLSLAVSLSTRAVCHLSMFTTTMHASTPRSQIHQGLEPVVCPPGVLSLPGSFRESAPTCNGAGAAALHQQGEQLKDEVIKAFQPETVGMLNDALLDAVASEPEHPSRSACVSATSKSWSSTVAAPTMPTALQGDAVGISEDTSKADDPQSTMPAVADMPTHQERMITETLTATEPALKLHLAPPAALALAPATHTWNMNDGRTESSPELNVSLNKVEIDGATPRSVTMTAVDSAQLHYHLSPDSDPISSPSKSDGHDLLSIYMPQNICYMPSFCGTDSHFISETVSNTERERVDAQSSSSQQLASQEMQHCENGAGLGVVLPDDQPITWHPWQLPGQTHVRLCKHVSAVPRVPIHCSSDIFHSSEVAGECNCACT